VRLLSLVEIPIRVVASKENAGSIERKGKKQTANSGLLFFFSSFRLNHGASKGIPLPAGRVAPRSGTRERGRRSFDAFLELGERWRICFGIAPAPPPTLKLAGIGIRKLAFRRVLRPVLGTKRSSKALCTRGGAKEIERERGRTRPFGKKVERGGVVFFLRLGLLAFVVVETKTSSFFPPPFHPIYATRKRPGIIIAKIYIEKRKNEIKKLSWRSLSKRERKRELRRPRSASRPPCSPSPRPSRPSPRPASPPRWRPSTWGPRPERPGPKRAWSEEEKNSAAAGRG